MKSACQNNCLKTFIRCKKEQSNPIWILSPGFLKPCKYVNDIKQIGNFQFVKLFFCREVTQYLSLYISFLKLAPAYDIYTFCWKGFDLTKSVDRHEHEIKSSRFSDLSYFFSPHFPIPYHYPSRVANDNRAKFFYISSLIRFDHLPKIEEVRSRTS